VLPMRKSDLHLIMERDNANDAEVKRTHKTTSYSLIKPNILPSRQFLVENYYFLKHTMVQSRMPSRHSKDVPIVYHVILNIKDPRTRTTSRSKHESPIISSSTLKNSITISRNIYLSYNQLYNQIYQSSRFNKLQSPLI
jgi:hypothetical protein